VGAGLKVSWGRKGNDGRGSLTSRLVENEKAEKSNGKLGSGVPSGLSVSERAKLGGEVVKQKSRGSTRLKPNKDLNDTR